MYEGLFPDANAVDGVSLEIQYADAEKRARLMNGTYRLLSAELGGVPLAPGVRNSIATFNKPNSRLSADWEFDDRDLIHPTPRFGHQAGGFAKTASRPADSFSRRSRAVKDHDVGIKTSWAIARIAERTNLAILWANCKNISRHFSFGTDRVELSTIENGVESA